MATAWIRARIACGSLLRTLGRVVAMAFCTAGHAGERVCSHLNYLSRLVTPASSVSRRSASTPDWVSGTVPWILAKYVSLCGASR